MPLSQYLPDREIWQKIRTIVLPIALQNLLMQADSVIDSIMVGHVSQEALASVSLAGQVQFIFNLLMGSCSCALSIFVSQYWGKKDYRTVEKLLGMSIQLTMVLAAVFFLATEIFPRQIMAIFTKEPVFIEQGTLYLRWLGISYFFLALNQSFSILCRCSGFAKQVFWISCTTVPLDMIFNYLLIFGVGGVCRWGVAGAAIATVIVRAITLFLTWKEFRREKLFKLKKLYCIYFPRELATHVIRHALPILGNYGCWGVCVTVGAVIMGHQEPDAVAANSLARVILNAATIFFSGFSGSAPIILGNLMGSGELNHAKTVARKLYAFTISAGVIAGIFLLGLIPFVGHLAKLTPRAAMLTSWMLVLLVPVIISKACTGFAVLSFNTGGDTKYTFRLDLIYSVGIIVPAGLLAAFVFHAPVLLIFLIVNADEILKAPICIRHFSCFSWLRDLTKIRKTTKENSIN